MLGIPVGIAVAISVISGLVNAIPLLGMLRKSLLLSYPQLSFVLNSIWMASYATLATSAIG